MLDGLLAFLVAQRAGLVAGFGDMEPIEIPIDRAPGGAFHLCSSPLVSWEAREQRYIHRRFPIHEAQMLGETKLRRVKISAGACRSYRIPGDVAFAEDDVIRWYCVGDASAIRALLIDARYLGKRRAVGRGAVDRWLVEECEPWGEGFPIVQEGRVMRPLPVDWPGLVGPSTAYTTLTYPYYERRHDEVCAVPSC